jgi:hypothetical protein
MNEREVVERNSRVLSTFTWQSQSELFSNYDNVMRVTVCVRKPGMYAYLEWVSRDSVLLKLQRRPASACVVSPSHHYVPDMIDAESSRIAPLALHFLWRGHVDPISHDPQCNELHCALCCCPVEKLGLAICETNYTIALLSTASKF